MDFEIAQRGNCAPFRVRVAPIVISDFDSRLRNAARRCLVGQPVKWAFPSSASGVGLFAWPITRALLSACTFKGRYAYHDFPNLLYVDGVVILAVFCFYSTKCMLGSDAIQFQAAPIRF